jgi:hypothetical protein
LEWAAGVALTLFRLILGEVLVTRLCLGIFILVFSVELSEAAACKTHTQQHSHMQLHSVTAEKEQVKVHLCRVH